MGKRPIARILDVNGIVQGVGFRPFVYNLAIRHHLKGEVANTPSGVSIHVEGHPHQIESFVVDLTKEYPPLAHVVEVSQKEQPLNDFTDFSIGRSHQGDPISTLISPDVSICEDCLRELFDPNDRRYRYPFINCINCGPRYTIIRDIPYDRPKTSMHVFRMCSKCQAKYDNPKNRRFHAQPNACEVCGPHLALFDNRHNSVEGRDSVKKTAALLKRGFIIAVKGLGGFHLVVDAENDAAVKRLRRRKNREEKPFAVMSRDLETICNYAESTAEEQDLLVSAKRPIVLLRKKVSNPISPHVAPSNNYFGVMLPYTPLHYLLLEQGFVALVMTSGNLTEEPIAIDNEDAFHRLGRIADYFLLHNRDIYLRNDDSVVRIAANAARVIRRSRGYVPAPVFLNDKTLPAMGVGVELKNTICVVKEDKAFLSQHIGDLENVATYEFFQLTIRHMTRILDVRPEVIAYDMHLIIEEGFPMKDLEIIVKQMGVAAKRAGVKVVTGDTKVVPKGAVDKIFINTSGVGLIPDDVFIGSSGARIGDNIILSGTVADHGVTIMTQREDLAFHTNVTSDSAPLNGLVAAMLAVNKEIHVLRDPTRGGVATALNEIAQRSQVGIKIFEDSIPVKKEVNALCELLGFDPLYLANEGKLLAFVAREDAKKVWCPPFE